MTKIVNRYKPDYVSPAGETLLDILNERAMTQRELANRMNRPEKTINEIIKAKAMITSDTAIQLESVLGVPANFWIKREALYQEYVSRTKEYDQLSQSVSWLQAFPLSHMIKLGWVKKCEDKVEQLKEVLNFFGVASIEAWKSLWIEKSPKAAFRISLAFSNDNTSIAAWLRHGEKKISNEIIPPYDEKKLKENLLHLRNLTLRKPEVYKSEIKRLCNECGIHVVFSPALPKATISGAVRWVGSNPLMQLSVRGKHNDKFWFTVFHEIAHILLHGKKEIFLEGIEEDVNEGQKEREADDFASEILIPKEDFQIFVKANDFDPNSIVRFARKIGIHSAIVVGQLQKLDYIPFSYLADMKKKLDIEMD
jgi:HTH-type transcriptional regulator/antitoxin HigA